MITTSKKRYSVLESGRSSFLIRARAVSKLTLPSLIPEQGHTASSEFETPNQSLGSRGVNNLAAKLLTSLFPPDEPFFRLTIDDIDLPVVSEDPEARGKVDKALVTIERSAQSEIESRAFRVPMYEALRHLIIAGNVLLFQPPNTGSVKVYPLTSYVVARDPLGNLLEIVIKESVSVATLTEQLRAYLKIELKDGETTDKKTVDRYTHIYLEKNKFAMRQEINDIVVPNSTQKFSKEELPFLALRFVRVDGEGYGRGYVEEYFGDLKSLEGLSKAIVEASAASARILFLIDPNSTTDPEDLQDVPNLGFATGREADITTLKVDKLADMQMADKMIERLELRLSRVFLLNGSVQRKGERVTAEEIRYVASELENALGGIYSLLSQELQLPVVNQILREMQIADKMPKFPEGVLKPRVVTGMDAIGRDRDFTKIERFIAMAERMPDEAKAVINWTDIIDRVAASSGLDTEGLIKSEEQVTTEQQKRMQEQMMGQIMEMAKAGTPAAVKAMADQN